jgi:hypothetical protein
MAHVMRVLRDRRRGNPQPRHREVVMLCGNPQSRHCEDRMLCGNSHPRHCEEAKLTRQSSTSSLRGGEADAAIQYGGANGSPRAFGPRDDSIEGGTRDEGVEGGSSSLRGGGCDAAIQYGVDGSPRAFGPRDDGVEGDPRGAVCFNSVDSLLMPQSLVCHGHRSGHHVGGAGGH